MEELSLSKHFQIISEDISWQEAIIKAVEPLIKHDDVLDMYKESILANLRRAGSHFIIAPYIILPHARPEQGVNRNAISVLLAKQAIYFEHSQEPIKLIIILASQNSISHLQILKKIVGILNGKNSISNILNMTTISELYDKFI